jgi:hypothetical protein
VIVPDNCTTLAPAGRELETAPLTVPVSSPRLEEPGPPNHDVGECATHNFDGTVKMTGFREAG